MKGCKKKLQELIAAEKEAETVRIVERLGREAGLDLEAAEFYVRSAPAGRGRPLYWSNYYARWGSAAKLSAAPLCAREPLALQNGERRPCVRRRSKPSWGRSVSRVRATSVPPAAPWSIRATELLGIEATGFSPGLRRLMTRAGSRESFAEASQDLAGLRRPAGGRPRTWSAWPRPWGARSMIG